VTTRGKAKPYRVEGRSLKVLKKERKKRREGATNNTNNYSDEEEKEEKVSGWRRGGTEGKLRKW